MLHFYEIADNDLVHIRINHVPQPERCNRDFYSYHEFSFSHL